MYTTVSEKEFAVISELSSNHSSNQRIIAQKLGISLGLTNLIINRLSKTGYIKIKQLDSRKIQYILTPKGFSEKAKKSYNYTLRTINLLSSLRKKIQSLILEKYKTGKREFVIVGDNELGDLVESSIKKLSIPDMSYSRVIENGRDYSDDTVLLYAIKGKAKKSSIDLISYLAESGLRI